MSKLFVLCKQERRLAAANPLTRRSGCALM